MSQEEREGLALERESERERGIQRGRGTAAKAQSSLCKLIKNFFSPKLCKEFLESGQGVGTVYSKQVTMQENKLENSEKIEKLEKQL